MQKIIEHLKKEKNIKNKNRDKDEEEGENIEYFNEKNILILESEEDKMVDETKHNSVYMNLFNEDYLAKNEQEKVAVDLEGDKIINYVIKLLENCKDDIRDYINHNKISNEYSAA